MCFRSKSSAANGYFLYIMGSIIINSIWLVVISFVIESDSIKTIKENIIICCG